MIRQYWVSSEEHEFLADNYEKWFNGELSPEKQRRFIRIVKRAINSKVWKELETASQKTACPLLAEYIENYFFDKQPHYLDLSEIRAFIAAN